MVLFVHRFNVTLSEFEQFPAKILPSRQLGHSYGDVFGDLDHGSDLLVLDRGSDLVRMSCCSSESWLRSSFSASIS